MKIGSLCRLAREGGREGKWDRLIDEDFQG